MDARCKDDQNISDGKGHHYLWLLGMECKCERQKEMVQPFGKFI